VFPGPLEIEPVGTVKKQDRVGLVLLFICEGGTQCQFVRGQSRREKRAKDEEEERQFHDVRSEA
jgi:hypothetical protein